MIFFFCLNVGKWENHTFERQMRIGKTNAKCCLLSNQTVECALLVFYHCFGNERGIRKSDKVMGKESVMRDFQPKFIP